VHVSRLENIVGELGITLGQEKCEAMAGLIREVVSAQGVPEAKDAALIAAAQRVEHYENRGLRHCEGARLRSRA
jgi:ferritin-like metal-binding protein YciE